MRTSFWLAAWFVLVFGVRGQAGVSLGFAIGSLLSLLSFWTLTWMVGRTIQPGSRRAWLLGLVLLVKLPVYGVALHYALAIQGISVTAIVAGIALVPTVVTLKAVGRTLISRPDRT